jgi:Uma2 family endonuclease
MSKTAIQEKKLTLDEFLSSPLASENHEYFDGELIQIED